MSYKKLLQQMIGVMLVMLLLVGCGAPAATPVSEAPAVTSVPPTSTPTTTPTNTPTPTPTPAPTATPVAGIGVPVAGSRWRVIVKGAHKETELTWLGTTYTPKDGYTFLVVDATFHNLDPTHRIELSSKAFAVTSEDGEIIVAVGLSLGDLRAYVGGGTLRSVGDEQFESIVFVVKEDAIGQVFKLQFQEMPPISFSVGEEVKYPLTTEVGDKPGALPPVCKAEGLHLLGDAGRLTFQRWEENGRVLAAIAPDGSDAAQVCAGIAFGNLQLAADGAALLLLGPQQGWPSLYLIESEGEIYPLLKNGQDIEARFDPSGRWVLFTTRKLGETGERLYVFDRKTTSATLVKEGTWVTFRFLADERLLVGHRLTEDGSPQYYLGQADGSALKLLDIPTDILASEWIEVSGDVQHIAYIKQDEAEDRHLFVADLDGGNAQELAKTKRQSLQGVFSPDGQYILIGTGNGDAGDKAELRSLTTGESWVIVTGSDRLEFGFSADSRWALVLSTVRTEDEYQYTLYVVHTADGRIREIADAIKASSSPDSTQLAYTVRQPDGNPKMYVTPLDGEAVQSLGPGVLSGWFPLGITPKTDVYPGQ